MKYKPEPGNRSIDERHALGVASVCRMFPDDARVRQWRAWAAKPFENTLIFPVFKDLPASHKRGLLKQRARWN